MYRTVYWKTVLCLGQSFSNEVGNPWSVHFCLISTDIITVEFPDQFTRERFVPYTR